jgi:hypothetical protein
MEDTCLTLRQVRDTLQNVVSGINDQNTKNRVSNQLSDINNCLEECEHIAGNISQR